MTFTSDQKLGYTSTVSPRPRPVVAAERPPLTTVEQPIEEIPETAVNALRALVAEPEKPLPHYSFRPRLRVRGSTAAPK